jgi:hypothetical protein
MYKGKAAEKQRRKTIGPRNVAASCHLSYRMVATFLSFYIGIIFYYSWKSLTETPKKQED